MGYINIAFKISAIIAIVAISLSYTDYGKHLVHTIVPAWLNPHAPKLSSVSTDADVYKVISDEGDRLYSKEELAKFVGGSSSDSIYLAILGRVYDVTAGKEFYTPGSGYGFFSGLTLMKCLNDKVTNNHKFFYFMRHSFIKILVEN